MPSPGGGSARSPPGDRDGCAVRRLEERPGLRGPAETATLRARCARRALLDCGPGCGAEPVRYLEHNRCEARGAAQAAGCAGSGRCAVQGARVGGAARCGTLGVRAPGHARCDAGRGACGSEARRGAVRGARCAGSGRGARHQGARRGAYPERARAVAGKGQGGAARLLARRWEKGCAPSLLPPAPLIFFKQNNFADSAARSSWMFQVTQTQACPPRSAR